MPRMKVGRERGTEREGERERQSEGGGEGVSQPVKSTNTSLSIYDASLSRLSPSCHSVFPSGTNGNDNGHPLVICGLPYLVSFKTILVM